MKVQETSFAVQEALRRPHDATFTIKRASLPVADFRKQPWTAAWGEGEGLRRRTKSLPRWQLGRLTPALLCVSVVPARIQLHWGN